MRDTIQVRQWDVAGKGEMELSIETGDAAGPLKGAYLVVVRMHHATPQGRNTVAQHKGFETLEAAHAAFEEQAAKMDSLPIATAR